MMKRPKGCDEENCIPLLITGPYDPDKPKSDVCYGVARGILNGKEKAIENTPSDIFTMCWLYGSHSPMNGRRCTITNTGDHKMFLEHELLFLQEIGLLRHILKELYEDGELTPEIKEIIESETTRAIRRDIHPREITIGTKGVEFFCSCGEYFFIVLNCNHYQKGKGYYRPTKTEEKAFWHHQRLGHTVQYEKVKRVKKSRSGDNKNWQIWGPHDYQFKHLKEDPLKAEGGGVEAQVSAVHEVEPEPGKSKPAPPKPVPNICPDGSYKSPKLPEKKGLAQPGDPGHCDG